MTDREAFKFGFMSQCIDRGFTTPEEMLEQVKLASGLGAAIGIDAGIDTAKSFLGGAVNLGNTILSYGVPLALAAPPIIGAGAGLLAAKAQDTDETDTDEAKRQEIVDTYKQEAQKLRRQGILRRQQVAPSRSRPMF